MKIGHHIDTVFAPIRIKAIPFANEDEKKKKYISTMEQSEAIHLTLLFEYKVIEFLYDLCIF